MIMTISFLIYDLNKCESSWNTQNVGECAALMEVSKSFAKNGDKYRNLCAKLPAHAITEELAKIKISGDHDSEQKTHDSEHKN